MIANRMTTIATRWLIAAVLTSGVLIPSAPAQSAAATSITGVYNGSYAGDQGPVKFKLTITQQDNGALAGTFTLSLTEGSATNTYTCAIKGFVQYNRTFLLKPGKWETPPPSGFEMAAGMNGLFDPAGGNGAGQLSGKMRDDPRPKFEAIRDADESAKTASAIADKKSVAPSATSVAPPARRPTAAQPAELTAIDGAYHGSYAGDKGPTKLKLTLTTQQDGTLVGVFTLYLPEGSGTTAYTCHMDGRYIPGRAFQLIRPKWETAAPKNLNMLGINGAFDAAGGQGAGKILGKLLPPGPDYEVTRDTAESASMPTVIAAKKAAKSFSPTVINGVYTGEFHRSDGDVKLKLSIKSTDDGSLTGLFTFELPQKPGSFITYKLTGRYDAGAHDQWGNRLDPFQFTTIEPVGSAAQDALNASKAQAARVGIIGPGSINGSLTGSRPGSGEFICSRFNATKDRTESADLDKVMAAQASAGSTAAAAVAPVVRSSFDGVYNG